MMQLGIDSFAAAYDETSLAVSAADRLRNLVEQIEHADQVRLDVFGVGEHARPRAGAEARQALDMKRLKI